MNLNKVAGAIVGFETSLLTEALSDWDSTGVKFISAVGIVEKYELDWGGYQYPGWDGAFTIHFGPGVHRVNKSQQLIRNQLNKTWHEDGLVKLRNLAAPDPDRLLRVDNSVIYAVNRYYYGPLRPVTHKEAT